LCVAGFAPAAEGFLAYREKDTKIRLANLHLYIKEQTTGIIFFIKSSKKVLKLLNREDTA
jgi:hypothetical protein